MMNNPSKEQIAIRDRMEVAAVKGSAAPSFAVDAKAGTGKTSTIAFCRDVLPKRSLAVAFNKEAATQLHEKLAGYCAGSTFHALGLNILRSRLPAVKVDSYKIANIVKKMGYGRLWRPYQDVFDGLLTDGIGIDSVNLLFNQELLKREMGCRDVAIPEGLTTEQFLERTSRVIQAAVEDRKNISFSEMLWLPLALQKEFRWNLTEYSHLIVDESQDVSEVRIKLIQAVAKHCVAVGDPDQAIYGFAGAVTGAFQKLIDAYSMDVLPLSTSWRCSREVIQEAQSIIGPNIFARPDAPQGAVNFVSKQHMLDELHSQEGNAVLCRTNAPLFELALTFLRAGKPFRLWNDFADRLLALANRLAKDNKGIAAYRTAIHDWRDEQLDIFKDSKGVCRRIQEQADCLLYILDESYDVADMLFTLDTMINSSTGPVLSTIHKTKGLEFENVFLYRPDFLPAPWVDELNEEEMQQEINLKYVAVTRAKLTFNYVDPEK